jgi:hypothetical protein
MIGSSMALVNGPYFSKLFQYRNGGIIAAPRISSMIPTYNQTLSDGATATNYQFNDINTVVTNLINSNLVPPPSPTVAMTYVVFTPGGATCQPGPGTPTGCNYTYGCNLTFTTGRGVNYQVAVVSGDGITSGGNASDNYAVFSHEALEGVTAFSNLFLPPNSGCGTGQLQLSDICNCDYELQQNLWSVQPYWSNEDAKCVLPEYWGRIQECTGQGCTWANANGVLLERQAYGGSRGVIFTDNNGVAYRYASGSTTQISNTSGTGRSGAEYAAGGNGVAAITSDASAVNYYNIQQATWYAMGAPNGPVTHVAVNGAGWVVAQDTGGLPYFSYNLGWVSLGTAAYDHVIAVGNVFYGIRQGKQAIDKCDGSSFPTSCSWQSVSNAGIDYWQVLGNPDAPEWGALVNAGGQEELYISGTSQSGQVFLSTPFQLGVSNGSNTPLVGYNNGAGGGNIWGQSSNAQSSWFSLGHAATGRLISGWLVWATSCQGLSAPCVNY